ncbi:MAG: alpha/beta hydrolase [Bacteroidetes bacterium]|nr:alpha/beta hydrolase [Bacteroidota bacterium]
MKQSNTKRKVKLLFSFLFFAFLLLNAIAFFHAYRFTHFSTSTVDRTKDPKVLTVTQKLSALFFGIDNPRPVNKKIPNNLYSTISLKSNKEIECWLIPVDSAKGTVILFHGFSAEKSSLIAQAEIFRKLGYATLLVDFMGSGGSEGNQTTIGYFEAEQVKTAFEFVKSQGDKNIYLFGTSMGSAAIMRAVSELKINPTGLILECPFGSMYQTVCARFDLMNVPRFPMAGLLVFWGGLQNGFWAFRHNPYEYSKSIDCPVLLIWGEKDVKVSRTETKKIFEGFVGRKKLVTLTEAGHENLMSASAHKWQLAMQQFVAQ